MACITGCALSVWFTTFAPTLARVTQLCAGISGSVFQSLLVGMDLRQSPCMKVERGLLSAAEEGHVKRRHDLSHPTLFLSTEKSKSPNSFNFH